MTLEAVPGSGRRGELCLDHSPLEDHMGLASPGRDLGGITAIKHRIGIMEVRKEDGNFCLLCAPGTSA